MCRRGPSALWRQDTKSRHRTAFVNDGYDCHDQEEAPQSLNGCKLSMNYYSENQSQSRLNGPPPPRASTVRKYCYGWGCCLGGAKDNPCVHLGLFR